MSVWVKKKSNLNFLNSMDTDIPRLSNISEKANRLSVHNNILNASTVFSPS